LGLEAAFNWAIGSPEKGGLYGPAALCKRFSLPTQSTDRKAIELSDAVGSVKTARDLV
jgi:hypothetical protein